MLKNLVPETYMTNFCKFSRRRIINAVITKPVASVLTNTGHGITEKVNNT